MHRTALAGVNFTNVLRAAFTLKDPKSAKKTVKLSSFFALLGSALVKAARKHVDEIDPRPRHMSIADIFTTRPAKRVRCGKKS